MVLGQKRRIKPSYKVEDEAILLESLHHKIRYSKTYICLDDLYKSCADFTITVNVYRIAAYWPPWLTK